MIQTLFINTKAFLSVFINERNARMMDLYVVWKDRALRTPHFHPVITCWKIYTKLIIFYIQTVG